MNNWQPSADSEPQPEALPPVPPSLLPLVMNWHYLLLRQASMNNWQPSEQFQPEALPPIPPFLLPLVLNWHHLLLIQAITGTNTIPYHGDASGQSVPASESESESALRSGAEFCAESHWPKQSVPEGPAGRGLHTIINIHANHSERSQETAPMASMPEPITQE